MKTLIKILFKITLIVVVLIFICESVSTNTSVSTNEVDSVVEVNTDSSYVSVSGPITNTDQHVNIVGLGDIDKSVLRDASRIIENFYGFSTTISGIREIDPSLYSNGDTLDADRCLNNLITNERTLFITHNDLYTNTGLRLRGYTTIKGNTIIIRGQPEFIKETVIHEIGHSLGLHHCSNLSCVMALNNDEFDSGDFCNDCKIKLNR